MRQKLISQITHLYLVISKSINTSTYRIGILHFLGFLFIVCIQTGYFFFYNKFSIKEALLWALLDWSIWYLQFLTVFYYKRIDQTLKRLAIARVYLFIGIIITFPLIHAFIGLYVYSVFVGIEGGFFESLSTLISRRWFHNMLIAAVLTLVFDYVKRTLQSSSESGEDALQNKDQIILKDGVDVYQFFPEEIQWVSAAKNYVIIETSEKQLLIRMTLNAIHEKINDYGFIKISRSMIVNKKLIQIVKKKSQYSQLVVMKSGHNFAIGRTHLKSVVKLMTS